MRRRGGGLEHRDTRQQQPVSRDAKIPPPKRRRRSMRVKAVLNMSRRLRKALRRVNEFGSTLLRPSRRRFAPPQDEEVIRMPPKMVPPPGAAGGRVSKDAGAIVQPTPS